MKKCVSKFTKVAGSKPQAESHCDMCQGSHKIYFSEELNAMTPSKRLAHCQKQNWCINCLYKGHKLDKCPSAKTVMFVAKNITRSYIWVIPTQQK